MEIEIKGSRGKLACYLSQSGSKAKHSGHGRQAVVVCFGLPAGKAVPGTDLFHKEVIERIANHLGWSVLSILASGVNGSVGNFTLVNWCDDLAVAAKYLVENNGVDSVLLVGYDVAGPPCLYAAARTKVIKGVATISPMINISLPTFDSLALMRRAESVGVRVSSDASGLSEWSSQFEELDLGKSIELLGLKPWLVIHGRDDELVSEAEMKEFLAESAGDPEVHFLTAGDHQLVTDPRMMAILLGWMERSA